MLANRRRRSEVHSDFISHSQTLNKLCVPNQSPEKSHIQLAASQTMKYLQAQVMDASLIFDMFGLRSWDGFICLSNLFKIRMFKGKKYYAN
jgi:hypothetical protein